MMERLDPHDELVEARMEHDRLLTTIPVSFEALQRRDEMIDRSARQIRRLEELTKGGETNDGADTSNPPSGG